MPVTKKVERPFVKAFAHAMPFAKFAVSVISVVLGAVTIPLGSPAWVPVVIMIANALGVFLTPNTVHMLEGSDSDEDDEE